MTTEISASAAHDHDVKFHMETMPTHAVARVFELEKDSYPADEAASLETIEYRASVTEGLCQIAEDASTKDIIGFVTATAAPKGTERMSASMMKSHSANGKVVCIHSVVVDGRFRRRGVGRQMLDAYVNNIKKTGQYERMLLISKPYLTHFYEACGFTVIGESAISHGKDCWIEMGMTLRFP